MAGSVLGSGPVAEGLSGGRAAPGSCAVMSCCSRLGVKHSFQRFEAIGLAGRLVPAQAMDAGKAHGKPGLVPGRTLQALERDFQHQALVGLVHHLAHRPEAVDGVAPHEAIDLEQFLVAEAEIRLADRHELVALGPAPPDPERDRKSTRLNSSHRTISYAVFC